MQNFIDVIVFGSSTPTPLPLAETTTHPSLSFGFSTICVAGTCLPMFASKGGGVEPSLPTAKKLDILPFHCSMRIPLHSEGPLRAKPIIELGSALQIIDLLQSELATLFTFLP
jgi:hypothetical protein